MENTVGKESLPPFVLNWTTPSPLIQTKRYKVKRAIERPEVLVDFPTLFQGFAPPPGATHVVDPFATPESLAYLRRLRLPVHEVTEDVFLSPPSYTGRWVVTVSPHGTPTDDVGRAITDKYKENDFYKCFLQSVRGCAGLWVCLPLSFFLGLNGTGLRSAFLSEYRVVAVRQFHGLVLRYDACSYVSVCFHRSPVTSVPLVTQSVSWTFDGETRKFPIQKENDWVLCADLYSLPRRPTVKVTRFLHKTPPDPSVQVTGLVLQAIDGGAVNARIRMRVDPHRQYGDAASKNLTTLCVKGCVLTAAQQEQVAEAWTLLIEELRQERWGLFMSSLDDQTTYSRRRIGYKLAFLLTEHVISNLFSVANKTAF